MERDDENRFGEYLKAKLREKGKSTEWLAKRAGLPGSYLRQLRRGVCKNPSLEYALRIVQALGVPFDIFLREAGYLPPYDPKALPENLRIAMRGDDWPPNVTPYEVEALATWGMMAEAPPGLDEIAPGGYRRLLEEMRGKPIVKIERVIGTAPRHVQERCYEVCRAIVNDWWRQQGANEKIREQGK